MQALADMPHILASSYEYYKAFSECRMTQTNGMSIQRINQPEIRAWLDNNDIDQDERAMFTTIIMAIDSYWMAHRDHIEGEED